MEDISRTSVSRSGWPIRSGSRLMGESIRTPAGKNLLIERGDAVTSSAPFRSVVKRAITPFQAGQYCAVNSISSMTGSTDLAVE